MKTAKPAPFCITSSRHGSMIINRNDYHMIDKNRGYGVGYQIMTQSCYDPNDIEILLALLSLRRHYFGNGVVAIDCGANIGVHTIEWADAMTGWGHVFAIEAQEYIFYALAGNIVLNNCLNATAKHAALGATNGQITIPEPDYLIPASFGSFELKKKPGTENIGQEINYDSPTKTIDQITLNSLEFERIDLIKIDVEGMEEDVLSGAEEAIKNTKPIMFVEVIKSNQAHLNNFFHNHNYILFHLGMNTLAIHNDDPTLKHLSLKDRTFTISQTARK